MLMLQALRNRSVSRLWAGQIGSAIGDEVFRVAFVWMSVGLIGSETGYLTSLQLAAVLIFGLFGGKWADAWSPYKTMIGVDLIRAVITVTPVVFYLSNHPSFVVLVASSVLLAGMGAFFEPAMQTVLPAVALTPKTLKAANGLMSTTLRFARVMGPAVIGVLASFVATIHFFTLNALSYLFSAACVYSIRKQIPPGLATPKSETDHILSSFLSSIQTMKKKPRVARTLLTKTFCGGPWYLVYGLGIALLIHEISPDNVKAFGLIMGAYGVGNITSALYYGNRERKNPEKLIYTAIAWMGFWFMVIGLSPSFLTLMIAACLTAWGGPMNDIGFVDFVQREYNVKDLAKIFRLRMTLETLSSLVFMLASPLLFKVFSIRSVIVICGAMTFLAGLSGFLATRKSRGDQSNPVTLP